MLNLIVDFFEADLAVQNGISYDLPLHEWAERAKKAHANAVENLIVFAPAMLIVEFSNLANGATTAAASIYLLARSLHYVVYTTGIPVVRTLTFFAGWGATVYLIARIGGVA